MKTVSVLLAFTALFGAAYCGVAPLIVPATSTATLIRTPEHDSAVVRSERFGANFAYSTVENQAYQSVQHIQPVPQIYTNVLSTPVVTYDYRGYYPAIQPLHPTVYLEQPVYTTYPGAYPFLPAGIPFAPAAPGAETPAEVPAEAPANDENNGSREEVEPQSDDDDSVAIDAI